MATDLVPHLSFDGRCEEAFQFYAKALRGEILMMMRYGDAPPEMQSAPENANRIMHARLQAGGRYLMGADAPPQYASKPQGFCVSLSVDDPAEAERVFAELSEGATSNMPLGPTFWAQRFG